MEKNCYITFVDEKYIKCIVRQMQRVKYLKTKYPYIILVDKNDLYTQNQLKEHQIDFELVIGDTFKTQINKDKRYFSDTLRFRKTFNKFKMLDYLNQYDKICWVDADTIFIDNQDVIFDMPSDIIFKGLEIDGGIHGFQFIITNKLNIKNFKIFLYKNQNVYNTDEDILNAYFLNHPQSLIVKSFKNSIHFGGALKLYDFHILSYLFNDIPQEEFNLFMDNYFDLLIDMEFEWRKTISKLATKCSDIHTAYRKISPTNNK